MITFGYNNKFSCILRALSAIAIGLVLMFGNDTTVTAVKVIAALLLLVGLVSLAYGYFNKAAESRNLVLANAAVDLLLGLILFLAPKAVAGFIVVAIGVLLVLLGILQIVVLTGAMSFVGLGFMTFVLSGVCVLLGAMLIWSPFGTKVMGILAGFALVWYGVAELIGAWKIGQAIDEYEKVKPRITDLSSAKEAEFTEVDEQ